MPKHDENMQRDAKGNVIAHRMTGFQASELGLAVVLRIEWEEGRKAGRPRARSVQLHLPPEFAQQIGENLVRVAPQHQTPRSGAAN